MSDKSKQDYVDHFSKKTIEGIFNLYDDLEKDYGYNFVLKLAENVLARYIFVLVLSTLSHPPAGIYHTEEETQDAANRAFGRLKKRIQEAVAQGFQQGQGTFEGRDLEYYCHLVPVKEPANKEVC